MGQVFFNRQTKVMFEAACEPRGTCNTDQLSFKAYFSRFLAASTKWMPQLYDVVMPYLTASAQAAAEQCDGTADVAQGVNDACGFEWVQGRNWDGTYGFGQQMSALEVIQSQMIQPAQAPVTASTGGTSKGDPNAGTSGDYASDGAPKEWGEITTASKAGAGILTGVVLIAWLGMVWWMI